VAHDSGGRSARQGDPALVPQAEGSEDGRDMLCEAVRAGETMYRSDQVPAVATTEGVAGQMSTFRMVMRALP
jgi:hypothetical protein